MARKTRQEAKETRNNILKAALNIIYEKGYARTTFVDIAEDIHLTKGAVYWHFKNKPDMFLALGRYMERKIEASLRTLYNSTSSLLALKRMLSETIHLITTDEQLCKYYTIVFYRMEWTDELMILKDFFHKQDQEMMTFVAAILEGAINASDITEEMDVESTARSVLALVDGLLGYCLSNPEMKTRERSKVVNLSLDTFFTGLQMEPSAAKTG